MLQINGKTFMNLQEAVQWLLDNNALPFQSSANYVANTEIGMGTIVNPSPAKVRIGSLIFFADSKVSTVIGLTDNGFICSDQYNDLVDDVVYVSNVALNASGHLIVTLSNGDNIDAGLVKQVTGFNINASQHLIVSYNDGTNTDLGAIFNGNIALAGNLTVMANIVAGGAITGNSIVETMTGYSFTPATNLATNGIVLNYVGIVKNGNKLTFVIAGVITTNENTQGNPDFGYFEVPQTVFDKLYNNSLGYLDNRTVAFNDTFRTGTACYCIAYKVPNTRRINTQVYKVTTTLTQGTTYAFRYECTFLLSDNLAS